VVTTVLDPEKASRSDLLELYRDRWTIELNLRSLKTTLGMDVLRGKSLDVVRKEILMHLLLYNLLRLLMWEAADGTDPRRLSFAGTLHRLRGVAGRLLIGDMSDADRERIMAVIVACVAKDALPSRPGRFEPRRVKRRKKNYSVMIRPRAHYRAHGDPLCR
jgi:hypothetical protein